MKNLNISVVGKVAKYLQRDGAIVCGNSDYRITFTFDSEWDVYETKTARFIWNGKYWDQVFSGNECPAPIITNATEVTVGVYAGDLSTTTPASIPCKRSILCGSSTAQDENIKEYRDAAVVAAGRAEAAATRAEAVSPTPDYIVAEAERVAKAIQATRTAKSLVFPVMSDMHLYDGNRLHDNSLISALYAGMGIGELKKRLHLDFTGYLGDYTTGASDYTAEQVMKDITAFKATTNSAGKEIWCVGNHDVNYGKNRDRVLTLDEVYSFIGANSEGVKPYVNIERGYGYLDFENQKIRVIYLNTCDDAYWNGASGVNAPCEWVSATQIRWIANTALDFTDKTAPSEWGIVIIGHHPLHYGWSCFDKVMQLLEAYRNPNKTSGTITGCLEYNGGASENVDYNFGNTERAEIICNIHGHNHNCGMSLISSTTRVGSTAVAPWLWRFCIPEICVGRYNGGYDNFAGNATAQGNYGEVDASGNPVYWYKETGTAKATSFCVVNIDRKNKNIHAHIFGVGKNRALHYTEGYEFSVSASNCTALSGDTSSINGGVATFTFNANNGYELPDSITVKGASYTWDKASGKLSLSAITEGASVDITATEKVGAKYSISVSVSNCTASSTNASAIVEGGTAALYFTANSGYTLPDSISVTGASYTWSKSSGKLSLSNPTANVSVKVTAVKGETEEPSYENNLLDEVGTVDGYISSSGGGVSSKSGYKTTGYIPIGYGSANVARGEIVLYLKNIDFATSDSSCRVGVYMNDANKTFIQAIGGPNMLTPDTDDGNAKTICTVGSDGFIATIDLTGITSYMHRNLSKTPGYIRFCSKGIDSDSILTLNKPIT